MSGVLQNIHLCKHVRLVQWNINFYSLFTLYASYLELCFFFCCVKISAPYFHILEFQKTRVPTLYLLFYSDIFAQILSWWQNGILPHQVGKVALDTRDLHVHACNWKFYRVSCEESELQTPVPQQVHVMVGLELLIVTCSWNIIRQLKANHLPSLMPFVHPSAICTGKEEHQWCFCASPDCDPLLTNGNDVIFVQVLE